MTPDPPAEFDLALGPRLVFGVGAAARIPELCRSLGARRVLLVSDAGLVAAGHVEPVRAALEAAGLPTAVFSEVHQNPTTEDVERCRAAAAPHAPDLILGLGGGSSLDTAKGANFLLTNGGSMKDYWRSGPVATPLLPMIAVPTTAGTGSEVQSFALISQLESHRKMACGDPSAQPRIALLDPVLTETMPTHVTAHTGIDTLTHAVESFVTSRRNPVSSLWAKEAFRLVNRHLETVLSAPSDHTARGGMLLASAFAGLAIEASMLGAAHALANPLTARFDTEHGRAVGLMLPTVVRFNAEDPAVARLYAELFDPSAVGDRQASESADRLARRIGALLDAAGMPESLAECGVAESDLDGLAELAAEQWTGGFNPRPVDRASLRALYGEALHGTR